MDKDLVRYMAEEQDLVEINSNNPHMMSFSVEEKEDPRINVYNNRTVSIQYKDGKEPQYYYEVTDTQLKNIFLRTKFGERNIGKMVHGLKRDKNYR